PPEPRDDAEHPAEPIFGVRLQRGGRSGGGGSNLSIHGPADRPHLGERRDDVQLGVRDWQRAPASPIVTVREAKWSQILSARCRSMRTRPPARVSTRARRITSARRSANGSSTKTPQRTQKDNEAL